MRDMASLALAGLLIAPTPAAAEVAPLDFLCSAPSTDSSQVRQELAGPAYRVSGVIRPGQLAEIPPPPLPGQVVPIDAPTHARGTEVWIQDASAVPYVVLAVTPRYQADRSAEQIADVDVWFLRDDDVEIESRELGTIGTRGHLWARLPFQIGVEAGRVIVEAGGQRTELPVALGLRATIELNCRGGSFSFEDVDWGD